MYRVMKVSVKDGPLHAYLSDMCAKSKNMYNAANFYIRQCMTGSKKEPDKLTSNEKEVLGIVSEGIEKVNKIRKATSEKKGTEYKEITMPSEKKWFLGYQVLEGILRTMENPDYKALSVHTAQHMVKRCCANWKAYFAALRAYKKCPAGFTGKPSIVGYIKGSEMNALFSNKMCRVKCNGNGKFYVKFPATKHKLWLGKCIDSSWKFMQLEAVTSHGRYELVLVFEDGASEKEIPEDHVPERIAAIDIGANNLAAITNNVGLPPMLVKGRVLKSANRKANMLVAKYRSKLTEGTDPDKRIPDSKRIDALWRHREGFISTYFHTAAKKIVNWLVENDIDTLVVGHSNQWKTECDIGKKNTQNFVCIPFNKFIWMLEYLCTRKGIRFIQREESYTSKASFLDLDSIPTCGEEKEKPSFSGRRANRLYKTGSGHIINADVNGSLNILRKKFPDAFKNIWEETCRNIFYPKVMAV